MPEKTLSICIAISAIWFGWSVSDLFPSFRIGKMGMRWARPLTKFVIVNLLRKFIGGGLANALAGGADNRMNGSLTLSTSLVIKVNVKKKSLNCRELGL